MSVENEYNKPRLLVLTDIGGDPDDEQSLVRLLLYANEFELEGIIPELWVKHNGRHGLLTPETQMAVVRQMLGRYGQVHANLLKHSPEYPTEKDLVSVLKRGKTGVPSTLNIDHPADISDIVGHGLDTEGSDWIISVVDRPEPRPVDVNVWGGTADLAQALWKVRQQRSAEEVEAFVSKIRVHAISDQDDTGPWIRENFPQLFYILDHARDGDKWNSCYRGMFIGGDESLTSRDWVETHVRQGHGPLGEFYPSKTSTGSNPHGCLKEGDTPSWFYFYENGLNVPSEPSFGGWGGRFTANGTFYQDTKDTVGNEMSHRATVWRWRPTFQNEFQARMDWCVKPYNSANHAPVAVINGDASRRHITISAQPGELITLDAAGSHDPDGDNLSYRWWVYNEAGTCHSPVPIDGRTAEKARIQMPRDAAGKTIHIILEVTDDGEPALTTYRRAVMELSSA